MYFCWNYWILSIFQLEMIPTHEYQKLGCDKSALLKIWMIHKFLLFTKYCSMYLRKFIFLCLKILLWACRHFSLIILLWVWSCCVDRQCYKCIKPHFGNSLLYISGYQEFLIVHSRVREVLFSITSATNKEEKCTSRWVTSLLIDAIIRVTQLLFIWSVVLATVNKWNY